MCGGGGAVGLLIQSHGGTNKIVKEELVSQKPGVAIVLHFCYILFPIQNAGFRSLCSEEAEQRRDVVQPLLL